MEKFLLDSDSAKKANGHFRITKRSIFVITFFLLSFGMQSQNLTGLTVSSPSGATT